MKQLTGLDASFLYMETPTTFGHVNGLAFYQRPHADFDPYTEVYRRFEVMVGKIEPLRRRIVEVPLGLDHPYWIDDPDFDLAYHVRHIGLPPPGAADQMGEQVARIIGRPMDRTRPLWEVYVIEGLGDDRWAMLTKFHHATVDGAAGVMMLNLITDPSPNGRPEEAPEPWVGEPLPPRQELFAKSLRSAVASPVKGVQLQLRLAQQLAESAGLTNVGAMANKARRAIVDIAKQEERPRTSQEERVKLPLTPAPPTPWNKTITAHRRFAMRGTSLENFKALRVATGATINDIVMACCAGALRNYLIKHDALPDKPLRAMVPVSIRTGNEEDPWTNRVSAIVADLPTNEPDPVKRLQLCREAMNAAKRQFELVPADTLMQGAQAALPVVATAAMRLASRMRLADRVTLPANVVISNVPGPRDPLYFAGAKLENYIPVSIVTDGMGLNITVHSLGERIDFGLVAARELVPDLWDLVDMHIDELDVLFEALGVERPIPQAPPFMRRSVPMPTAPTAASKATAKASPKRSANAAPKKSTKASSKKSSKKSAGASSKKSSKKSATTSTRRV
jgi:diacylglycerol O-acyltransferase / wax synthase